MFITLALTFQENSAQRNHFFQDKADDSDEDDDDDDDQGPML